MQGSRTRSWVILALILTLLITAYVSLLERKNAEDRQVQAVVLNADSQKEEGFIKVTATVVTVDPLKGDVVIRLEFMPDGDLLSSDGMSPDKNLVLNVNNATGKAEVAFKKGEAPRKTPSAAIAVSNIRSP